EPVEEDDGDDEEIVEEAARKVRSGRKRVTANNAPNSNIVSPGNSSEITNLENLLNLIILSSQKDLTTGSVGPEVMALQKFLNSRGFLVAPTGVGSPGN